MAELKTRPSGASVEAFLDAIPDEGRRRDAKAVMELMREVTGLEPEMWGDSMVGFGSYRYTYPTGNSGEWFLTGFSPRKQNLTLYIMAGFAEYDGLLQSLGKHKTGKSCLYLKRLEDADPATLRELVRRSVRHMRETHA